MIDPPDLAAVKLALRVEEDHGDANLSRMIRAGTERANVQAPDAPADTAHEAIIRFVGYLYEAGPTPDVSQAGVWRRCGSEGLLSPWRVRRAGVIGC